MSSGEFCDNIDLPFPEEILVIHNWQWQLQRQRQLQDKMKNRNSVVFTGIVLSVLVVIASIACVSARLIKNTNIEYRNSESDRMDWHSIPGDDHDQDDNRNTYEIMILPDRERDDVLMDDEYNSNFDISHDRGGFDQYKKGKIGVDLSLYVCPPAGEHLEINFSDIIPFRSADRYHRIMLENSSPGILCTLVEVTVEGDLQLKPIGRSYNGRGWEPYRGQHSGTTDIIPTSCSDDSSTDCLIDLPPLSVERKYALKSYRYSLGSRDEAARFLERTTFGPTTSEINAFVADGSNHTKWITDQIQLPITSHRQFFRERANNFHGETTWMGTLDFGPCQRGARYRRFVFVAKDIGRYLTISTSSIDANYKVLSVGGHVRSVIPGRVKRRVSTNNKLVVPDGSYEICSLAGEPCIGSNVGIKFNSTCYDAIFDGIYGNPVPKLDKQHLYLVEYMVRIDVQHTMPAMADFFEGDTQIMQLASDIFDERCPKKTTGAPEKVTIATIGEEFWIHTPSFRLQDNRLEAPLDDGGRSAVEKSSTAPYDRMRVHCSNAPRTFLNEDHCLWSKNACSSSEEQKYSKAAIVCGSPYEVATIHSIDSGIQGRGGFDLLTKYNRTLPLKRLEGQRETVWFEISLQGEDQLRQRMAWALSQILAISPDSLSATFQTESFLAYYDIFVRNAFGNYFDVLKEVTFSPMMAEMLTYNNGVSTGLAWTKLNKRHHADENYARELLQLFSIGLYKLNDDGTTQKDPSGHEIRTYKNHDISEYAKVFVGFKKQRKRGNIEDGGRTHHEENEIDPLQIIIENKDYFPKLGMDNKYVGDGYPLCKDLPPRNFLRKGATFRFVGSNPMPELLSEPDEWYGNDPVRISLDPSSVLRSKLCNKGEGKDCVPSMKLILDSDIDCSGVECVVEELRTFEVEAGSDLWFEYIRPPCVNHAFYENGFSIRRQRGEMGQAMCGDPKTLAASTVCCDSFDTSRDSFAREELFTGERLSFASARTRCSSSVNTEICENPFVTEDDCKNNGGCDGLGTFYWSSVGCSLTAKINQQGKIAIIHNPQIEGTTTHRMVRNDTEIFFRVNWLNHESNSLIQDLISNCANFGCVDEGDNQCICSISTRNTLAFVSQEDIKSAEEVLSSATVGALIENERNFLPIREVDGVSIYPDGELTEETVFQLIDSNGRVHYRKNIISEVHIGRGSLKFRNPVTFYSLSEPTIRDARYEIDAALHHSFFHENMATFLAIRLAQRFGESNPSPRYIKQISMAFRTGAYQHYSSGLQIGSGRYGCLTATIAAILLDNEVADPILDADPTHGSIQEPYLKLVKVLRSLEFNAAKDHPLLRVESDLQGLIGQQSHKLPSVFSFFKSEYQPAGWVTIAGMSSPESQVLSGVTSVQMTNTIISYLKYGVTSCFGGFGGSKPNNCRVGATFPNNGESSYDPGSTGLASSMEIVAELATLLTSGRLGDEKREIIKNTYEDTIASGKSTKEALINAQQLIITSPEFHTTNLCHTIGRKRSLPLLPEPNNNPYKAVIFIMLPGGYDSFNVLVPKECSVTNSQGRTVLDQYMEQRGPVAFDEASGEFNLTINATGSHQPCSQFAIHDELTVVKDLYDSNDLAFLANAGIINNQGMTKSNYHDLTRSQLFAHNMMQHETAKVDPYDKIAGTGVMGRAKDILSKSGYLVSTMSIDNPSIATEGVHGMSPPSTVIGRRGYQKFATRPKTESDFDIEHYARILNGEMDAFSGIFGETWSQQFSTGIEEAESYQSIFDQARLDNSIWKTSGYSREGKLEREHREKWSTIAKVIQKKDVRKNNRDIFFVELGSWDHHNEMKDGLRPQLRALNHGLEMFVEQAKSDGFWDDITVVISSDFGRTLTPNSNDGTDHGWGGHYMIMGGDVQGGQILGEYPSDLTPSGRLVDDHGRFIPTTSWDSIWNGILEWTGVTYQADLDYCLPNRHNTASPVEGGGYFPLLTASAMFKSSSLGQQDPSPDGSRRSLRGREQNAKNRV